MTKRNYYPPRSQAPATRQIIPLSLPSQCQPSSAPDPVSATLGRCLTTLTWQWLSISPVPTPHQCSCTACNGGIHYGVRGLFQWGPHYTASCFLRSRDDIALIQYSGFRQHSIIFARRSEHSSALFFWIIFNQCTAELAFWHFPFV